MARITVPNTSATKRRDTGNTQFKIDTGKANSSSYSLTIVVLVVLAIFLSAMILSLISSNRGKRISDSTSEQVKDEDFGHKITYAPEVTSARITRTSTGKRSPEERWKEALAFTENNPNDYKSTTEVFRKIKNELAGTEYEKMADQRVMELANLQMRAGTDSEGMQTEGGDMEDFLKRMAAAGTQTDNGRALVDQYRT